MFFPGQLGTHLRDKFWRKRLQFLDHNNFFDLGIDIGSPKKVHIGDNLLLARDCVIGAIDCERIFIGNDVSIGRGTYLHGSNHRFDSVKIPINK